MDASPAMIERAVRDDPDPRTTYELGDLATWAPAAPVDLVVSNAALQWVPGHLGVVERLRDLVAPGGSLAFQVPCNAAEPNHVLLGEVAGREPYAPYAAGVHRVRVAGPEEYLDALAGPGWDLDVWETTY